MQEGYIAVDFGASNGRVIFGTIKDNKLELKEIYRFANYQVLIGNHLYWDFPYLFSEMKKGIKKASDEGYYIKSIGIDTWGVDFGFIDKNGNLLSNPIAYRDGYTQRVFENTFTLEGKKQLYYMAGVQSMNINSLYQLLALKEEKNPVLEYADKMLFMPDLFAYYLTNEKFSEYTIASTSELLNAKQRDWNYDLIKDLSFRKDMFCCIVKPGVEKFKVKKDIIKELNLPNDCVFVPIASHDTQSAVYTVKDISPTDAYLSSGTWSLLGCQVKEPILNDETYLNGFSNEGSVDNQICLLQNITGLWILQCMLKIWENNNEITDLKELNILAAQTDFDTIIDVDNDIFMAPKNMKEAIDTYCHNHSLKTPTTQGEYVRCIFLSLANRYKKGIEKMSNVLGKKIDRLTIMGGGSKSILLNELTSKISNIEVRKGVTEASATGNILLQAKCLGDIQTKESIDY